jgi:hypothetical protein
VVEPSWPSPNIKPRTYYLNGGGSLDGKAAAESRIEGLTPQSLGENCGAWCGFGIGPEKATDQRTDDGRSICFDSDPLAERLEIVGAPVVSLELAVDRPIAFVAVRLNEVTPDGASARVSYGLINLTHRDSHEHPKPVVPGERMRVSVQLNDVAHAFAAGNRLRVALSTSYWPLVWPSPEPVTLSLFTGASTLILPSRKPRPEDAKLRPFGDPESAEPLVKTYHRPAVGRRWVERDIGAGTTTYRIEEDMGNFTIEHLGLETDFVQSEAYRIKDDDPLSAEIDIRYTISIGRGDWQTRSETRTTMRADKTHFMLEGFLDAFEGDKQLVSRHWNERIPRDLV